jgi:hypothetical protein
MAKFSIVILSLALLFVSTFADPLFLLSSQKIGDLSDNVFLDTQGVNDLLNNKILGTESAPNAVFVFNVKIQDKKYLENPSLLVKEVSQYSSLKNTFKASANTFSSLYVKDAFTKNFNNEILNTLKTKEYELIHLPLRNFNAAAVKEFKATTEKKILSVNELSLNELKGLDQFFQQHFASFAALSHNNYLVVLKFTDATDANAQVVNNIQLSGRMLEETTTTTTTAAGATLISISPAGFAGYVIAVILALFLYGAVEIMKSVRSPNGFNKTNLLVGKEH